MRCLYVNIPPDDEEFARMCREISTLVSGIRSKRKKRHMFLMGFVVRRATEGLVRESELAKSIRQGGGLKNNAEIISRAYTLLSQIENLVNSPRSISVASSGASSPTLVSPTDQDLVQQVQATVDEITEKVQTPTDVGLLEELLALCDKLNSAIAQLLSAPSRRSLHGLGLNIPSAFCAQLIQQFQSNFNINENLGICRGSACDEALLAVNDKRTLERVMRYVLGSNARVAKFAAQVSVASREHDDFCANWAVILEERGTRSSLQGQVPNTGSYISETQMRQYEGLVETRHNLLRLRPYNRHHWVGLAVAYQLLGNLAEAKQVLEYIEGFLRNVGSYDVEFSELLMCHIRILEDMADFQSVSQGRLDRMAGTEMKARLLAKLKESNADDEQKTALTLEKALEMHRGYFNVQLATAPRRLPLHVTAGQEFTELIKPYLTNALTKGIPSLFADLKSLHKDSTKRQVIEDTVEEKFSKYKEGNETFNIVNTSVLPSLAGCNVEVNVLNNVNTSALTSLSGCDGYMPQACSTVP
ncbi:hypothetical protein P692DRAFT_20892734 [Suillus brevipes Sb2]|nr:hypothetical protein P692DRAFT_20892734 [Suillus brevipes Sb2]